MKRKKLLKNELHVRIFEKMEKMMRKSSFFLLTKLNREFQTSYNLYIIRVHATT